VHMHLHLFLMQVMHIPVCICKLCVYAYVAYLPRYVFMPILYGYVGLILKSCVWLYRHVSAAMWRCMRMLVWLYVCLFILHACVCSRYARACLFIYARSFFWLDAFYVSTGRIYVWIRVFMYVAIVHGWIVCVLTDVSMCIINKYV
jgi:hypothetical protein